MCCQFTAMSINSLVSLIGSFAYLVGSILFIPSLNTYELGLYLFILGSLCVVASEGWKIVRVVLDGLSSKNIRAAIKEDAFGFLN
jgi:hypothetical protein